MYRTNNWFVCFLCFVGILFIVQATTNREYQCEQGERGLRGRDGVSITGATGAQGAQGDKGDKGEKGEKGDKGDQGASGAPGASIIGPTGARGETGAQGASGAPGAVGAQGDRGPTGAQGAQGEVGATGATGATGDRGPSGSSFTLHPLVLDDDTNLTLIALDAQDSILVYRIIRDDRSEFPTFGLEELRNNSWIYWTSSDPFDVWHEYPSAQGPPGENGANGVDGVDGVDGIDGIDGEVGATGPTGASAPVPYTETIDDFIHPDYNFDTEVSVNTTSGFKGSQYLRIGDGDYQIITIISPIKLAIRNINPSSSILVPGQVISAPVSVSLSGAPGIQGAMGPSGPQGDRGSSGAPGDKGDKGDKGDPGDQGVQGEVGAIGPTGAQGATGAQGVQGPPGPQIQPLDRGDIPTFAGIKINNTLYSTPYTTIFSSMACTAGRWPDLYISNYGNRAAGGVTKICPGTGIGYLNDLFGLNLQSGDYMINPITPDNRATLALASYLIFKPLNISYEHYHETHPNITFVGAWRSARSGVTSSRGVALPVDTRFSDGSLTYTTGSYLTISFNTRYIWCLFLHPPVSITNYGFTYAYDNIRTAWSIGSTSSFTNLYHFPHELFIDRGESMIGVPTLLNVSDWKTSAGLSNNFYHFVGYVATNEIPTNRVTIVSPFDIARPSVSSTAADGFITSQEISSWRSKGVDILYAQLPIGLLGDETNPTSTTSILHANAVANVALSSKDPSLGFYTLSHTDISTFGYTLKSGIQGPVGDVGPTGATGPRGATTECVYPFIDSDASILPPSGCQLWTYGDSITRGDKLSNVNTQAWPVLLANDLGCTLHNRGVNGAQWIDNDVYDTYISGPVILSYGTNDLQHQTRSYEHIQRIVDALAIYCTLKNSGRLINARGGLGVVTNGVWSTGGYATVGIKQVSADATSGAYVEVTIIGRYIFVGMTSSNTATASASVEYLMSVDGANVTHQASTTLSSIANGRRAPAKTYHQELIWYDTGSDDGISHVVRITPLVIPVNNSIQVDWFAGYDRSMIDTETVIINSIPNGDMYRYHLDFNTPYTPTADDRSAMNEEYEEVSKRWRHIGLPIYYNEFYGNWPQLGMFERDGIHPIAAGHVRIKEDIKEMLLTAKAQTTGDANGVAVISDLTVTNNQITFGTTTDTTVLRVDTPSSSRIYTIPDVEQDDEFVTSSMLSSLSLKGCRYHKFNATISSNGSTILYTCPTARPCIPKITTINPTAGSIAFSIRVSRNGIEYQVSAPFNLAANTRNIPITGGFFEPGDLLVIKTAVAGLQVIGVIISFPPTMPLHISFARVNTTHIPFYTVPDNKWAHGLANGGTFTRSTPVISMCNLSAASVTFTLLVTDKYTQDTRLVYISGNLLTANTCSSQEIGTLLGPGDALTLYSSSDAIDQHISLIVLELDDPPPLG